jgi:dihydroorotate dehydrogenase
LVVDGVLFWFCKLTRNRVCSVETNAAPSQFQLFNRTISNPIGLAAGFDKHGECIDAMLDVGFGLVEIGSVTPVPQAGNPRPRLFRLSADEAAINRYGLNSHGADEIRERLGLRVARFLDRAAAKALPATPLTPSDLNLNMSLRENKLLGVNLSKNKSSPADSNEDYVIGVRKLGALADYLVINVSCPNQVGITSLQRKGVIEDVIKEVRDTCALG